MSAAVTIYDPQGNEVELPSVSTRRKSMTSALNLFLGSGGYAGARGDKTSLKTWNPGAGSADSDTLPDLPTLRPRSRDLRRNDPLAAGAYGTAVDSVVGCGLQLESTIDRKFLGIEDAEADAWQDAAERFWKYHAGGRRLDITGEQDDVGLCNTVFGSTLESGDVFSVRRFVERPGDLLATRVQLIEADRVETPADLISRQNPDLSKRRDRRSMIRSGIELDADGMPMAYWIRDQHPGESLTGFTGLYGGADSSYFRRVMARNEHGDRLVLHHFDRERPMQSRGVPWFAPVIETLKQLGRYSESELMAAVVSSFFTVYVKSEFGEGLANQPTLEEWQAAIKENEVGLKTGGVFDLLPNQSIEIADPKRPNAQFDPFFMAMARQVGVALHLPFELLVKHFTASYSAAQAAMLEARRFFRIRRVWLVRTFLQTVYGWVIEEAVARGLLAAPGFFSDPLRRQAWLGAQWVGDPWGHIRPDVEVRALGEQEDRGWVTRSEATALSAGGDWEQKLHTRAREQRLREEVLPNPDPTPLMPGTPAEDPDDEGKGDE